MGTTIQTESKQQSRVIETLLEISIPTATAIIVNAYNPFEILIGLSTKHSLPVLPGGKIDNSDIISTSLQQCAEITIKREIYEETSICVDKIEFLGEWQEREQDVRTVPVRDLRDSVIGAALKDLPDDYMVKARYGVPDFVFIAKFEPAPIADSVELSNLRWIDIRNFPGGVKLGAGHDAVVQYYYAQIRRRES